MPVPASEHFKVAFVVPLSILAAGSVVAQSVMEANPIAKTIKVPQTSASKTQPGLTNRARTLCASKAGMHKNMCPDANGASPARAT